MPPPTVHVPEKKDGESDILVPRSRKLRWLGHQKEKGKNGNQACIVCMGVKVVFDSHGLKYLD